MVKKEPNFVNIVCERPLIPVTAIFGCSFMNLGQIKQIQDDNFISVASLSSCLLYQTSTKKGLKQESYCRLPGVGIQNEFEADPKKAA